MSERGQSRIVCAANKLADGTVILGARHWDRFMHQAMSAMIEYSTPREEARLFKGEVQGFIDQFGTFYDRQEAWKIAEASGQILHRCGGDTTNGGTLFSENLY